MNKKLFLVSVVLAMALAGSASAAMIAHWSMDDNAGDSVVTDSLGQNDGTLIDPIDATTAAHHVADGKIGGALHFFEASAGEPPRGDYVDVPYNPAANLEFGTGPYSISVFFRQPPGGGVGVTPCPDQDVFIGKFPAWVHGSVWKIGLDNDIMKYEHEHWETGFVNGGPAADYQDNEWHHVAVVKSSTGADGVAVYVNGVFMDAANAFDLDTFDSSITIARQGHDACNGFYLGDLDDIALFDHALSENEINDIYVWGAEYQDRYLPWNPRPGDGETDISIGTKLQWTKPYDPNYDFTYDVYYSKDPCLVVDVTHVTTAPGVTEIQPSALLDSETEYFWRVDATHPVSGLREGDPWHFTSGKDICDPQLIADFYGTDCVVDLSDFAVLASQWLECTRVNRPCP